MNVKQMITGLFFLGMVYGLPAAIAEESVVHDHQKMKMHHSTSSGKKETAMAECVQTETEHETGTSQKESSSTAQPKSSCEPKKSIEQRHDHRDSKNL
tara:strand:- start:58566 stop:58859 length:294 start_codon:yes stop_codon:yes gene_type:complete